MAPLSDRKHQELLNGPTLKIIVGSGVNYSEFRVPMKLLSHYSSVFKGYIDKGVIFIEFENGYPEIMRYVLEYLCRGFLGTIPRFPTPSLNLLRVYFLAEKLDVGEIRHEIMNRFAADLAFDPMALGVQELRYIYNHFEENTPIRKLAAKWPAYAVLQKLVDSVRYIVLFGEIPKFALDFVMGVRDGRVAWMRGRRFFVNPTCQYHEYADTRFCGYGNREDGLGETIPDIVVRPGSASHGANGVPNNRGAPGRRRNRNNRNKNPPQNRAVPQPMSSAMPAGHRGLH
ncbi:hypothetical protein L228DRAFT_261375 [Xylona heveae TC161]|uniref:BTB domain-containing protein n=1 Tax=Xylona heveae (strain CBS 132557 / TC161) TaxID=1328760 RepID=A0A165GGP0_XYLHT|nr:hypothetical protein L228DRAFT_261375 [Xylona heveae TC161]KZF22164.1 hypothetical protein L228DRAFT_261375 [Xylona heveae TC161]